MVFLINELEGIRKNLHMMSAENDHLIAMLRPEISQVLDQLHNFEVDQCECVLMKILNSKLCAYYLSNKNKTYAGLLPNLV